MTPYLGRGIASMLGEEGATVYITGRSTRGEQTQDFPGANKGANRPSTQGEPW